MLQQTHLAKTFLCHCTSIASVLWLGELFGYCFNPNCCSFVHYSGAWSWFSWSWDEDVKGLNVVIGAGCNKVWSFEPTTAIWSLGLLDKNGGVGVSWGYLCFRHPRLPTESMFDFDFAALFDPGSRCLLVSEHYSATCCRLVPRVMDQND